MAEAIVAFPVKYLVQPTEESRGVAQGVRRKLGAERLRRVGVSLDRRFDHVEIWELNAVTSHWQSQKSINLKKTEIFVNANGMVCVCHLNLSGNDDEARLILNDLRRPGTAAVRNALLALGIEVDSTHQIRATAALRLMEPHPTPAVDACIEVGIEVNEFLFSETWGFLVALICAERMLLDAASDFVSLGRASHKESKLFLRKLTQWRSVLGADRTILHVKHEELRNSLRLDKRYDQLLEIFKEDARLDERRWNLSTIFASLSITVTVALLPNLTFQEFGLSSGLVFAVSILLFVFAGRIKR